MPSVKTKSYLHLHLIVFIWGFTGVLGELISVDSFAKVWYRMSIALVLVGIYMIFTKKSLQITPKQLGLYISSGFVIAIHWLAFFEAIEQSNVSITLAALSTGAFFTAILEPFFYKRKIIAYEVIFGLFVILGLYIIYEVNTNYTYGILLGLFAAFTSSCFSLISGKFAGTNHSETISFYQITGGVLLITIYLLSSNQLNESFFSLTKSDLIYLLILGSICTAYTFVSSINVMKHISPYTVMLTINLEPIYGIILALILFPETEKMNSGFYIGAAIIIITILANGYFKLQKR